MATFGQLPPWLTETVKPSEIAMRGAQIGNILADNAMRGQQIAIQRDTQAAELALRQQAAERAAEQFAREQDAREQELAIRRELAASQTGRDAQRALQDKFEADQKVLQFGQKLNLDREIALEKNKLTDLERKRRAEDAAAGIASREKIASERNKATVEAAGVRATTSKDTAEERLRRELRGAEAELAAAELIARDTPANPFRTGADPVEALRSKVINLRAQIGETDRKASMPTITTAEQYDALPSGTIFVDPEGKQRRKP
jgi:hypothetical protein